MVKPSHILGLNARNHIFEPLNPASANRFGTSKLRAKSFLAKHGITVAELYAKISSEEELRDFKWDSINGSFVIKPANGSAGKGVLVIARRRKKDGYWIDLEENELTIEDLSLHVRNILQGEYSTWGSQPVALIEERVTVHPDLQQYVEVGTPDIRVIVFNKIPVMAMVRIPTHESGGRANLHQGAFALGIDMGTGETVGGVGGNNQIFSVIPGRETKAIGIEIPYWNDVLRTAVRTANATGFMYCGVDIFIHPEKGPMVAEVNRSPGLSIQLANRAGLLKRLQRVEEIEARNVSHAVKIAQSLFAESVPSQTGSDIDLSIVAPNEQILVYDDNEKTHEVLALMNTGRYRSAISVAVAKQLGLSDASDLLWNQEIEGEGKLPVVEVKFKLKHRVITTQMVISKKLTSVKHDIEIGRKDLVGFLVGETV